MTPVVDGANRDLSVVVCQDEFRRTIAKFDGAWNAAPSSRLGWRVRADRRLELVFPATLLGAARAVFQQNESGGFPNQVCL
jgi:hypothetical protein